MQRRLLLLSNSRNYGQSYLEHARVPLQDFLGDGIHRVAFVPFAGVTIGYDDYAAAVREPFSAAGYELVSVHEAEQPAKLIEEADAVAVGGGNTFRLLQRLYEFGLRKVIREEALAGKPYVGWSAGSNIACPTIRTTNDMPIVEPPSLDALDLIPFQINPHYLDAHPDKHQGETREERILEFVTLNPGTLVVGLREGSILRVESNEVFLLGDHSIRVFGKERDPGEITADQDLSFLVAA